MRTLIAVMLAFAGSTFAAGWTSASPVTQYYTNHGCGADTMRTILIVRQSGNEYVITSKQSQFEVVLDAVRNSVRTGKAVQLYTSNIAGSSTLRQWKPNFYTQDGICVDQNSPSLYKTIIEGIAE